MNFGWENILEDGILNILPLKDIKMHRETSDCHCKPRIEPEDVLIVIHNAYDGREFYEEEAMEGIVSQRGN